MTRSGSANKKLPSCDYFAELSFLRDVVTGRKTESNIQVIQPVDTATTATPYDPSTSSAAPLYSDIEDKSTQPSSSVIRDTRAIRNARKRRSDQIDELLAISLAQDFKNEKTTNEMLKNKSEDQDVLFCSSLVKTFQKLKGKKNRIAKMKVLEILVEFENDDDE
jgi:hypothetical protein